MFISKKRLQRLLQEERNKVEQEMREYEDRREVYRRIDNLESRVFKLEQKRSRKVKVEDSIR